MKKIPFLIAFFSISNLTTSAEEIAHCVSTATGGCIRFDIGASGIANTGSHESFIYLTAGNHYLSKELNQIRAEALIPLRPFVVGLTTEWFGYSLYHRLSMVATLSKQLNEHWSLGYGIRTYHIDYEGNTRKTAYLTCDLFFRYQRNTWEFYGKGIHLFGPLPRGATIGTLLRFSPSVSCALESSWQQEVGWLVHWGMTYQIDRFTLRCGAVGLPLKPTFGCGFQQKRMRIDVAAQWVRNLGYHLCCGVGFTIKE